MTVSTSQARKVQVADRVSSMHLQLGCCGMEHEVAVRVHGVFPLRMGIERENRYE